MLSRISLSNTEIQIREEVRKALVNLIDLRKEIAHLDGKLQSLESKWQECHLDHSEYNIQDVINFKEIRESIHLAIAALKNLEKTPEVKQTPKVFEKPADRSPDIQLTNTLPQQMQEKFQQQLAQLEEKQNQILEQLQQQAVQTNQRLEQNEQVQNQLKGQVEDSNRELEQHDQVQKQFLQQMELYYEKHLQIQQQIEQMQQLLLQEKSKNDDDKQKNKRLVSLFRNEIYELKKSLSQGWETTRSVLLLEENRSNWQKKMDSIKDIFFELITEDKSIEEEYFQIREEFYEAVGKINILTNNPIIEYFLIILRHGLNLKTAFGETIILNDNTPGLNKENLYRLYMNKIPPKKFFDIVSFAIHDQYIKSEIVSHMFPRDLDYPV